MKNHEFCNMKPYIYIETERLILRDWTESDRYAFAKMNSNPNVMRYFPKSLSEKESNDFVDRIEKEIKEYGFGLFAVECKLDGSFIGFVGFHKFKLPLNVSSGWEIGWRLSDKYWGRGFATEAASACLNYAKTHKLFSCLYSFTSVINTPSKNVMKKIGMNFYDTFQHPNIDGGNILKQHVMYQITL